MTGELFRRCYGKLPEPTLLVHRTGQILEANPAARALLPEAGPLAGTNLQAIVSDAPAKVSRLLALWSRTGDLLPGALTFTCRNGDGLSCRIEGTTVERQQQSGIILLLRLFAKPQATRRFRLLNERVEALNRGLIERQRAQAKLHAEQEWLQATLASIGDAVIATDTDGRITLLNRMAHSLTGWTQEQAAGLPLEHVFVTASAGAELSFGNLVSKLVHPANGAGAAGAAVLQSKNGRQIPIEHSAAAIRDRDGSVAGVVVVFRDISERLEAERAVASWEARLRFMAESMPEKVFTAKPNGDVDFMNRQWLEFTGVPFEQMKDWNWVPLIHPDDVDENVRRWKRSLATGEPFEFLHRFRRADGAYRWHLSRAHAHRNPDGTVAMWIGSNTEIHEQKEIEEELRRANQDLHHFAFAASHDLQEPLRMITSYAQLLLRTCRAEHNEDASVCVEFIRDGTRRMRELLSDLLTYTQITAREQQEQEEIDLNLVLRSAAENLRTAIDDSGAVVTNDPLPVVRGHEVHFLQLFQNLIGNAIKYRGTEAPRIHVSVQELHSEHLFSIVDNGMGIDPLYHNTIFGIFKRLHGNAIPGTGIGLAICQRVVERYEGRIWVESEPRQGATFYFTLPRAPQDVR